MVKSIVQRNRKEGKGALICICSAHPDVIEASFQFISEYPDATLSIESTVQQVNQDGGYTGMKPRDFVKMVRGFAKKYNVKDSSYVLAGDHLGPNVWKKLSSLEAMQKSKILVRAYVEAGYSKIHIDPSMACADDAFPLSTEIIADRTAALIAESEKSALDFFGDSSHLFYVVGTEVPVPGGSEEFEETVSVTPIHEVEETIQLIQNALLKHNVSEAWGRVHGIVVQPGVEFGDDFIFPYKKKQAANLFNALKSQKEMVFEAHSTDYQTKNALQSLVQDHFAILKVGPELTFAWREALFSLDMIADEIGSPVGLKNEIKKLMLLSPGYWEPYYKGSENDKNIKMFYSLSDRIRYYWAEPSIISKINALLQTVNGKINIGLHSQFLKGAPGSLSPQQILFDAVKKIIQKYYEAAN